MRRLCWGLGVVLCLAACDSVHLQPAAVVPASAPPATKVALTPAAAIDWPLIRDAVLVTCQNCHRKLKTFAGVTAKLPAVLGKVSSGEMPPAEDGYAPLDNCQLVVLKRWIDLGAPEESTATVGELPECATLNATK